MDSVAVPFVPTGLWLLAVALAIAILLVTFFLYAYQHRRLKALLPESQDVADLAARKQVLQGDEKALREWMTNQKAELDRLQAERREQETLRAELAGLERQIAAKDQENQALRNEVGELENQRHLLGMTLDKVRAEIGDLEGMRGQAEGLRKTLAELEQKCQEAREAVRVGAEAQVKLEAMTTQKLSLERVLQELKDAAERARQEEDAAQRRAAEAKAQADEEGEKLSGARREKAQLEASCSSHRDEQRALVESLVRMKADLPQLENQVRASQDKVQALRGEREKTEKEVSEAKRTLREVQDETEGAREKVNGLLARKAALEEELKRLSGRLSGGVGGEADPLAAYADLIRVPPTSLTRDHFPEGAHQKEDENSALQRLRDRLNRDNLKFPSRVIDAFHTSLKCHDINPLTVLAGVSGTGKTLLPMRYAETIGMHSLVMSVQPRWDAPQDMFGFYNYLEKQYKATDLSRVLVRMDPYNYRDPHFSELDSDWARERMLLVLLDEMNLARTEYYFSEFLSKLELRRLVSLPADKAARERAEIELDAGPSRDIRFRLWIEHNVLFVGTMNEDETTQTLSDKVLDRANIIRFGKPDEKTRPASTGEQGALWKKKYIPYSHWKEWLRPTDEAAPWYNEVFEWTRRLNNALEKVGRPFGFRVQQAVGQYVANYPRVDQEKRHRLAFADQIEQKIIPKLRGIDVKDDTANECLDMVEGVINSLGDSELDRAFEAARRESESLVTFRWRGVTRTVDEGLA